MSYSKQEKIDIILIYGKSDQCLWQAVRLYRAKFPERNCPSRSTYGKVVKHFFESGSVNTKKCTRTHNVTNQLNTRFIMEKVAENPHVSTRQLERVTNISKTSIIRILHEQKFHPYHVSLHQDLHGRDFENRLNLCQWGLQQYENDELFFERMLFTDEASFTNHGQLNLRNMHYWSLENPRWLRQVDRQRPWTVNVWCGILNNQIIGPYFINGTLNGQKYVTFLQGGLQVLLDDVPLDIRGRMWYQHDGCPAHSTRLVRQILNTKFPNSWIGRTGRVAWPSRSPDLTPTDYFLWGHLKKVVYCEQPTTPENMKDRIITACAAINPTTFEKARESLILRFKKCIDVEGHHLEHLLQ
ncbi:hypothetical protein ANTPLA_LOCUS2883 [Anthophora plagiata]